MINSSIRKQLRKSISLYFVPKPAIALDLDDTLVHLTPIRPKIINIANANYFPIKYQKRRYYIQKRPDLQNFLKRLTKLYDVFIFTSSQKEYANLIIDKILPDVKDCRRFFRDSCLSLSGYSVKDLSILRRPLKQTLLIDDTAGSALKNPSNLVRVRPWNGEKGDKLLLKELMPVLEQIAFEKDIGQAYMEVVKSGKFRGLSMFI